MIAITSIVSFFTWNRFKTLFIILAVLAAVWFYKDYQFQKNENVRQSENVRQQILKDSLRYAQLVLDKQEIETYLENNDKKLNDFLKKEKINRDRIERIITQKLEYRDNQNRSIDLQPVLDAIKDKKEARFPVIDSTECMIIKGYVIFKNDTLQLDITDREFKNKSDIVSYWERRQWSFLGIKTRIFGKKQATVIIKDDCGRTETIVIDKKSK